MGNPLTAWCSYKHNVMMAGADKSSISHSVVVVLNLKTMEAHHLPNLPTPVRVDVGVHVTDGVVIVIRGQQFVDNKWTMSNVIKRVNMENPIAWDTLPSLQQYMDHE